ncbi:choice-of-anchor A family protein [Streptomyces sp. NPDC059650]|uniref:choice-of-anchor A family protein n=1 Tax=Streptomyces sp. NPDC059650 TaxID=3346896 RepID=UPI0036925A73
MSPRPRPPPAPSLSGQISAGDGDGASWQQGTAPSGSRSEPSWPLGCPPPRPRPVPPRRPVPTPPLRLPPPAGRRCPGASAPASAAPAPTRTRPSAATGSSGGRDDGINVFVGGDFLVRERASEAEGRIVVLGGFDHDKAAGFDSRYSVGVVAAGSLVPPPAGADFLTTGGNVTVAAGERLLADTGVVRHAGTLTGVVSGTRVRDTAAVRPYAALRDRLSAASRCYARPTAGTCDRPPGPSPTTATRPSSPVTTPRPSRSSTSTPT